MNTFDELLYQIDGEDTFESEFSSFLTDDDSMYAEDANKVVDVTVAKFKSLIEKAKKVDKKILIAIAAAAALTASIVAIIRHNTSDKTKKAKLNKAMNALVKAADASKVKEKKMRRLITNAEKWVNKVNPEKLKEQQQEILSKKGARSDKIYDKNEKYFRKKNLRPDTFAAAMGKKINSDKTIKELNERYSILQKSIEECERYIFVINELKSQYNNGQPTKESVYSGDFSEYSNIMETAVENFIDDEISFGQLVTVSGKAAEKYGVFDESYDFDTDDYDDEYTEDYTEYEDILDAICEKFDNDEISSDEALYLIEKASDKYLDDDDDYLECADDDTEKCNEEYSRLVDAICEKFNNDEISADDTILLLEKAAERYSVDETSVDETDDLLDSMLNDD